MSDKHIVLIALGLLLFAGTAGVYAWDHQQYTSEIASVKLDLHTAQSTVELCDQGIQVMERSSQSLSKDDSPDNLVLIWADMKPWIDVKPWVDQQTAPKTFEEMNTAIHDVWMDINATRKRALQQIDISQKKLATLG